MSTWPSILTTISDPIATNRLNSPSHSSIEQAQNDAIKKIETFVGTQASAVGTLIYNIRAADSGGGGHVQTAVLGGTGQTAYTKGDILVAVNSSTVSKLAIGTDEQILKADSSVASGVKWGGAPVPIATRVYEQTSITGASTSSLLAIWTKPAALSYLVVEVQGGGGGGGAVSGGSGGGGGAGAYAKKFFAASALPAAVSVITGSGGLSEQSAGKTLFGSILQVGGGTGTTDAGSGGGGSVLVAGDVNRNGQPGGSGNGGTQRTPGAGGSNVLALGGPGADNSQDGIWGGGGTGSQNNATAGSGGNGIVILTEY